jgi:DNA mismatch endonuclease Vsr
MSRIRGKDTTPEHVVRSILHRMGYRFRLHVRIPIPQPDTANMNSRKKAQKAQTGTPAENAENADRRRSVTPASRRRTQDSGLKTAAPRFVRPDIILPKHKTAIFVHGCFWHRHRGCRNCTTPANRREWWLNKLEGNAAQDKIHQRALRKLGWRTVVIWECQTERPISPEQLTRQLAKLLR